MVAALKIELDELKIELQKAQKAVAPPYPCAKQFKDSATSTLSVDSVATYHHTPLSTPDDHAALVEPLRRPSPPPPSPPHQEKQQQQQPHLRPPAPPPLMGANPAALVEPARRPSPPPPSPPHQEKQQQQQPHLRPPAPPPLMDEPPPPPAAPTMPFRSLVLYAGEETNHWGRRGRGQSLDRPSFAIQMQSTTPSFVEANYRVPILQQRTRTALHKTRRPSLPPTPPLYTPNLLRHQPAPSAPASTAHSFQPAFHAGGGINLWAGRKLRQHNEDGRRRGESLDRPSFAMHVPAEVVGRGGAREMEHYFLRTSHFSARAPRVRRAAQSNVASPRRPLIDMNAAKLKLEARAWGEREQLKSIRKAFSEPKACPVIRRIAPRSQVDNDACDDGGVGVSPSRYMEVPPLLLALRTTREIQALLAPGRYKNRSCSEMLVLFYLILIVRLDMQEGVFDLCEKVGKCPCTSRTIPPRGSPRIPVDSRFRRVGGSVCCAPKSCPP
jgi:hypothetical protein